MKVRRRLAAGLVATVFGTGLYGQARITVEDLLRFATIGAPKTFDGDDLTNTVASFSPNGERVAVVIRKGNPQAQTNEAELLLYETARLLDDPQPQRAAAFASSSNQQPITNVSWLDDQTLVFGGTDGAHPSQVYRLDLRSLRVEPLTQESGELRAFAITPSGDHIAALVRIKTPPPEDDPQCLRNACRVTEHTLSEALRTGMLKWGTSRVAAYHPVTHSRIVFPSLAEVGADKADSAVEFSWEALPGGISANGRFTLQRCTLARKRSPHWWSDYTFDPSLARMIQGANAVLTQLYLFDLEQRTSRPLTAAPSSTLDPEPIWIEGGRKLILVGVEPLVGVDEAARKQRAAHQAILLIDPVSGASERIAQLDPARGIATDAWWNEPAQSLTVETTTHWDTAPVKEPAMTYQRKGRGWISRLSGKVRAEPAHSRRRVELIVEQSLNDRPVLVAVDLKRGIKRKVLDPNPWLGDRALGHVELIRWSRAGKPVEGLLYYPPDYRPGQRYPLFLQTHGFVQNEFSLPGVSRNFPGQALAAHGIIVLQSSDLSADDIEAVTRARVQEWPAAQAAYEGAVDHLDALGLIDRERVGIVGWSRTGPTMAYTLTHSDYPFAAAAFTDSAAQGYWYYLYESNAAGLSLEDDFGAPPFGEGLASWLELSPGFHFDRVRTPTLMWQGGTAVGLWDWYAGLRRFEVPVEYWTSPDGRHAVWKASQRLFVNQLLVDWFRFWLKDEEDPDQAKADQYARWRVMREQQKAVLQRPRPPLLKWQATPVTLPRR